MPNQNILRMLNAIGGGASESYGQGSMLRKGGQPVLPKPAMSMPDMLSPYAPGNQQGGPQAQLGGNYHSAGPSSAPARNSTQGVVPNEMAESGNHPIAQLAQYLTTSGAPASRQGRGLNRTDAGAFIRGGTA